MVVNLIEIGRLVIMVSPLATWPVMTMVLHDRKNKKEKGQK